MKNLHIGRDTRAFELNFYWRTHMNEFIFFCGVIILDEIRPHQEFRWALGLAGWMKGHVGRSSPSEHRILIFPSPNFISSFSISSTVSDLNGELSEVPLRRVLRPRPHGRRRRGARQELQLPRQVPCALQGSFLGQLAVGRESVGFGASISS